MPPFERTRVVVARGARALELELTAEVARLAPRDPAELASPVRVVVPSASLRNHVICRLVAPGRALAGVAVQTLQQVALEVLERAGEAHGPGAAAYEILVRRAAAHNRQLAGALAGLDDPFAIVEAAVSDLLDAGFSPDHLEAVLDKVEELEHRVAPHRRQRVGEVVRVASEVAARCIDRGVWRPEQAPQHAAELLREHGAELLAARAIVIHGFGDVTGVAADLLRALLAVHGGVVLLDRPVDPAEPAKEDAGVAFLDRLEVAFGGLARQVSAHDLPVAQAAAFAAPTLEAEARQVAHRVRRLLDDGVEPEGIGIVVRELRPAAAALRRQLDRLAVPFSGAGSTVPGGLLWRRSRLIAAALRGGPAMAAELWLEAAEPGGSVTEELLALRTLGVTRLAEVAELEVPAAGVSLPVPVVEPDGEPRRGRVVPARRLRRIVRRAASLVDTLAGWPKLAAARTHLRRTGEVLAALCGDPAEEVAGQLEDAAAGLAGQLSADMRVTREEWLEALCRRLEQLGEEPVGGAGGGVQLLSVMEARGRTFEHLFVMSLVRGVFPRVIQEDALLPDEVRGHLAAEVLPEFPVKARGLDEERYLFAQLVSSASAVTLSWHLSDQGAALAPSPFVERLRREGRLSEEAAPAVLAPPDEEGDDPLAPRSALEHAIVAAEHAPRDGLEPLLAAARDEGGSRFAVDSSGSVREWARARVELMEVIDPVRPASGPGPWAGLVGEAARPGGRLPSITGVENLARCPLQVLLVRRLGLSPMPDPRLGLPDPGGLLIGSLVHGVLQRIVDEATGRGGLDLDEAVALDPVAVVWPAEEQVNRFIDDAAESLARQQGLTGLGMAPLLAAQARPYLDVARRAEWGPAGVLDAVVGAEVTGDIAVDGIPQPIAWRADRLDRSGDVLAMVDYKTGKPPSDGKREDTRHRHLLRSVALGNTLQGVAYALAAPEGRGEGRYLYLRPEIRAPEDARHLRVAAGDAEAAAAFAAAVRAVAGAWYTGAMFPRMEEPGGTAGRACAFCAVADACLVNDSGVRRRIVQWLASAEEGLPIERAARALWRLGSEDRGEDGDGEAEA